MASTKLQAIHFRSNNNEKSTDAELQITQYNDQDRLKRALLKLGLFWLLAVGSIPIIFAHWVLVPGFFIAGPFMAIAAYKTSEVRDHARGVCPTCEEQIQVKFDTNDVVPRWTYCPKCNKSLHIDN